MSPFFPHDYNFLRHCTSLNQDGETGTNVFANLIGPNGLLKGCTRVLVTHAIKLLPIADTIMVLKDGKPLFSGSYEKLQRDVEILSQIRNEEEESEKNEEIRKAEEQDVVGRSPTRDNLAFLKSLSTFKRRG